MGCGTVLVSGDKIQDACRGDFPWNGIEQGNGALQEETGKCDWYNIPEIYWEEAVQELLGY